MMVAGIGCRKGVAVEEVISAIALSLDGHGLGAASLSALATAETKRNESAILAAGEKLGLPVRFIDDAALAAASPHALSRSAYSLAATGTPSLSEAAALAATGTNARLLGPRTVTGHVTCAIATSGTDA